MAYIDKDLLLKDIGESVVFTFRDSETSPEVRGARKIIDRIKNAPTADVVPREVMEQIKWERDIAIEQLASYGVCLGEKKELVEVKHGEWKEVYKNKVAIAYECSNCNHLTFGTSEHCICGAKMDGRK